MTIEHETGDANIVIWEKVGETHKQAVFCSSLVLITGFIQREGDVVHRVARTAVDYTDMLASLGDRSTSMQVPHQQGDEFRRGRGDRTQGAIRALPSKPGSIIEAGTSGRGWPVAHYRH